MMKISPEKRIWVNGVRFDMFKQKYDNVSELCHARLDDVIDEIDALLNKLDSQSHTSSDDEYDE